jgi:hypothetical protein
MSMNRINRGWALAKESFAILRANPQMLLFPIVSSAVTIGLILSFVIPAYWFTGGHGFRHFSKPLAYVLMAGFYFLSYFIVIFFNSALVGVAYENLHGRSANFTDGINTAARKLGPILGWTLIASTVGMILQIIREESGIVGRIVSSIIGISWNIATYFVVPILIIEPISPIQAVKKSTAVLRQTWGEGVVGSGGIGLVTAFLFMIPIVPLIAAATTGSGIVVLAVAIPSVIYWAVVGMASSSMTVIFQTALYIYMQTGTTPNGYSPDLLQTAFVPKNRMRSGGFGGL